MTRMKSISMNTDEQVVLHTTEYILFDRKSNWYAMFFQC